MHVSVSLAKKYDGRCRSYCYHFVPSSPGCQTQKERKFSGENRFSVNRRRWNPCYFDLINNRIVLDEFNYQVKRRIGYAARKRIQDPSPFDSIPAAKQSNFPILIITDSQLRAFLDPIGYNLLEQQVLEKQAFN
mmetsp:Transcript_15028/g.18591  ORF Transcript_15028/g.18591 Transcript_15028/m.18591 type:complete len:134 (-) Transcript_15028:618-1019(-)